MMSTYDQIFGLLKKLLLGFLDLDESKITPEVAFRDLGVDSLDFVEVQVELQKVYGVTLTSSIFASGEVQTLHELVSWVQRSQPAVSA